MREHGQQEGSGSSESLLHAECPMLVLLMGIKSMVFLWAIILFGGHHVQIITVPKMPLFMVKGMEDPGA